MLAYECFWNNKPEDALMVIHWAIEKFPEAHNLYDSQGEFESTGDIKKSESSYKNAIKALLESEGELQPCEEIAIQKSLQKGKQRDFIKFDFGQYCPVKTN